VQKVKQVPTKTLVKAKAPTPARPSKPAKSERQIARDKAEAGIKSFCGRCHAFPDPRQFTMETWMTAIRFKYKYFKKHKIDMAGAPPPREVMGYFAEFAARTLLIPSFETPDNFAVGPAISAIGRFEKTAVIADMVAVSPKDGFGGDVLVSDLLSGRIEAHSGKPGGKSKLIGQMTHPARMTVVDLDRDKRKDVIVAELGTFGAGDHARGKVIWLRQKAPGKFEAITLLDQVGRVSEIAAADLDGDTYPDLVVAEFGWLNTGSLSLLKNPGKPAPKKTDKAATTKAVKLDAGRGAVSVAIGDLDGDGLKDIAALFGQEREEVVILKNRGDFKFRYSRVYEAANPLWGATILRLADLDGDKDLDILVGNGDTLDSPRVAGFQGVHLLSNEGRLRFKHRQLVALPGIQDMAIADMDGDKDLDLVLVASVTPKVLKMMNTAVPAGRVVGSAILLRHDGKGNFKPITLSKEAPCFSAVAIGAAKELYVGNFGLGWDLLGHEETIAATQTQLSECVDAAPLELWRLGPRTERPPKERKGPSAWREAEQKRLRARETAFRRLLISQPLKPDYFMGLGITLAQLGEKKEALKVMKRAIQLHPKSPELNVNIATLLNTMDEYKEALVLIEKALRLRPIFPEAFNAKSIAMARIGRVPEAVQFAQKAIKLKPKFLPFRFNLINLYMYQRKGPDALDEVNRILRISPRHPAAESMKLQLTRQLGRPGRGGVPPGLRMPPPGR